MSKVTSKFQVSIPKTLAQRVGIKIGDELEWEEADGTLRVRRSAEQARETPVVERLALFDAATARQRKRQRSEPRVSGKSRGWTREDLYTR